MAGRHSFPEEDHIEDLIHDVRGHRVIFDAHLAKLYGVQTRVLVQAVRRNASRFPDDFAFQVTIRELAVLKSQTVILKAGGQKPGGRRRGRPWAFTEHGVVMVANVLRSPTLGRRLKSGHTSTGQKRP